MSENNFNQTHNHHRHHKHKSNNRNAMIHSQKMKAIKRTILTMTIIIAILVVAAAMFLYSIE